MNRREFLKSAGAGAACLMVPSLGRALAQSASAPTAKKPNILVIMSDEHNASILGCYGNKLIQSPNLDRLAEKGVVFDSAYTNSPLCVPCRLSFTAGQYISRISAWNNSCWLPDNDMASLPNVMNAAGYQSYLCGKMHYDASKRYGFKDYGGNMNNAFMDGKGGRMDLPLKEKKKFSGRFKQNGPGQGGIINHDKKVTAGTLDFLSKHKPGDKPFFFLAGYIAPHFPLQVPEKYIEPYKGKVGMPEIPAGFLDTLPRNYKCLRNGFEVENVPESEVIKARECYNGLMQWLDEEIGKVFAALEKSDAADNTIVIYTSDHGENNGEHGLWYKNAMYEQSARVPLIISFPPRWKGGQRRTFSCSLVDVVQTIADLGGATAPQEWNGESMVKWLDNESEPWRDIAVSEYYAHNISSGYAMLRHGQYKYVYHTRADEQNGPERELYDLAADPKEFKNLANDPDQKQRIEQMHAMLLKEVGEDPEIREQQCRREIAKGYGRKAPENAKAKKTEEA